MASWRRKTLTMAAGLAALAGGAYGAYYLLMRRPLPKKIEFLSWLVYSVGRWEGDTLVVDTIGFNDRSWLDG